MFRIHCTALVSPCNLILGSALLSAPSLPAAFIGTGTGQATQTCVYIGPAPTQPNLMTTAAGTNINIPACAGNYVGGAVQGLLNGTAGFVRSGGPTAGFGSISMTGASTSTNAATGGIGLATITLDFDYSLSGAQDGANFSINEAVFYNGALVWSIGGSDATGPTVSKSGHITLFEQVPYNQDFTLGARLDLSSSGTFFASAQGQIGTLMVSVPSGGIPRNAPEPGTVLLTAPALLALALRRRQK